MFDTDMQATVTDPRDAADLAGLIYVHTDAPGIGRRRAGKGFSYIGPDGRTVSDAATLERVRGLVIPPAWRDVWISPKRDGHIQAIGYDDKGRRQYIYHPRFRAIRDGAKFEHMIGFAEALPALRERVAQDMARRGLPREKVLATVVHLLETTMIRVGNSAYAKANGSFGLTTLRARHVKIERGDIRFHFKGKSNKVWRLGIRDRRVAKIIRACQELPGQDLFQYLDDDGQRHTVSSTDVNAYLRDASGRDITAKDFRTWLGTVLAATALAGLEPTEGQSAAKRNLAQAIRNVAERLGNTATVCRKCYVHPEVMSAYMEGELLLDLAGQSSDADIPPEEAAVLAFLRARLARDIRAVSAEMGGLSKESRLSKEIGRGRPKPRDLSRQA